jgi:hypothetical protein
VIVGVSVTVDMAASLVLGVDPTIPPARDDCNLSRRP